MGVAITTYCSLWYLSVFSFLLCGRYGKSSNNTDFGALPFLKNRTIWGVMSLKKLSRILGKTTYCSFWSLVFILLIFGHYWESPVSPISNSAAPDLVCFQNYTKLSKFYSIIWIFQKINSNVFFFIKMEQ